MDLARLFCFGFEGLEAPDSILFALDRDRVGAVILFARNCRDGEQIRKLCRRLREAGGEDLWILVDQEGGRVRRITDPEIGPRAASELASAGLAEVEKDYALAGRSLARLGIDFNLAPVADVRLRDDNSVLAGRTFGSTVEGATPRVAAAVSGLRAAGVKCCAKHFPGLGDVGVDPHHVHTRSHATAETFREVHFPPFAAAVGAGVDAVMTTHVLAPALDPERIATFSHTVVADILEAELGFTGLVLTDDLEMKGTGERAAQAAWYAFEAGHHLMLMCHSLADQEAVLGLFRARVPGDHVARQRIHRALNRQEPLRNPFTHAIA